jgi:hypothetical protein
MKTICLLFAATILLMAPGCKYEAPLVKEHQQAIDPALLGLWEEENEDGKNQSRMLILRYSDTEYLVHYPVDKNPIYYRAYPIRLGGMDAVQLEMIGIHLRPIKAQEKERFHVARAKKLAGDKIEITLLNTDLVEESAKNIAALKKAFLANQDQAELFTNPGVFKKVTEN